ncbi:MAG: family 20 glycosylhydrolase [Phycisphaerales bacterium]|nr:MAG: family 20 glycosylhydrolase [Phycisphaerales bacterium]
MDNQAPKSTRSLLPIPVRLEAREGACSIGRDSSMEIRCTDKRVERAASRWRGGLSSGSAAAKVLVAEDSAAVEHGQGYRLVIEPGRIELVGGGPAGCFHGLQTLRQLTDFAAGSVACCRVEDQPDFATRGLLHDVTRGKVPTMATLRMLVDRLASLKINQLQLNIEHAFVFAFDPEICGPNGGLTPDEIRELDQYAKERFIDLVPALATFGHMGKVLSMPRYRHLAEIEASKPFEEMSWPERMRGLTLDCLNPDGIELIRRMWSEVLEAFSSPMVNICGDEPWDLAKGKNRDRLGDDAAGEAYVAQVKRTHEICRARGRAAMFWSDVIANYAHLIGTLPPATTILHWGYDDRADYEKTAAFVEAGLTTFVCPGTSGWKRIINAMDLAERNIATFAKVGRRVGAAGLLNTDWGDHGHFQPLSCSWHGIALGAARGWAAEHAIGKPFDERFARLFFDTEDTSTVTSLRAASAVGTHIETWRQLWTPLDDLRHCSPFPTEDELEHSRGAALEAADRLRRLLEITSDGFITRVLRELGMACTFHALWAERMAMLQGYSKPDWDEWADRLLQAAQRYVVCWNEYNKPSGLSDIVAILEARAEDARNRRAED